MGRPDAIGIDELLAEWEGLWLESLKQQIYDLHHRRQLHDEFMEMLDAQDHPDTDVFRDAFHRMYIEAQVMGIRRQADRDSRTLSLRRLIGQLETHRHEFTREWYVGRWTGARDPNAADERERLEAKFKLDAANAAFDRFTDKPGDDELGGRRLQEDREKLLGLTEAVARYANATVAHLERDPHDVSVTYAEFHLALEHLGDLLRRYYLLINQGALISTTPTIQGDWKGPFRKPLA
jgi:hypothetical protein